MLRSKLRNLGLGGAASLMIELMYSRSVQARFGYGSGFRIGKDSSLIGRSNIQIGRSVRMGNRCRIETISDHLSHKYSPRLIIGDFTAFSDDVHIGCIEEIVIGSNVLLASKIYISDHNHGVYASVGVHSNPDTAPNDRPLSSAPVTIEDNVWIGEMVTILPGVRVGRGSIIGAGSIVTKSIDPYCIAVGNPAKVVKRYNATTGQWEQIDD
jgi:acetyltransferase-like isoleucine patch superfamily enzyme